MSSDIKSEIDYDFTAFLEASLSLCEVKDEHQSPRSSSSQAVDTQSMPIPHKYLDFLHNEFGYNSFRPLQWTIIKNILQEEEKRDNCAILTSGYGKSLIYEFPAIFMQKVVIVVSPIVSLMKDQMPKINLRSRACIYHPNQLDVEKDIHALKFNIVYVAPEHITSDVGLNLVRALDNNLLLIAIEEAHCVSQYGHDFRLEFRKLCQLRMVVPNVPLFALTGTATLKVCNDICNVLGLRSPRFFRSGYDRPNLFFIVKQKSILKDGLGVWRDLINYILWAIKANGSIIVYCNTISETELVADILAHHVPCGSYHNELDLDEQKKCHLDFSMDNICVIVTTMSFGMIIDKFDVRLVVHYGAPSDMERYYQEIGHGGRDGLLTKCVLFYNSQDWKTLQNLRHLTKSNTIQEAHLENLVLKLVAYTQSAICRRKFILKYFSDEAEKSLEPRKDCCDNCLRKIKNIDYSKIYDGLDEEGKLDISQDARLVLTVVRDLNVCYGLNKVISVLRGSCRKDLSKHLQRHTLFGKGINKSYEWYKLIAQNLQTLGYLDYVQKLATFGEYSAPRVMEKAKIWLNSINFNPKPIKISPYAEILKFLKRKKDGHSININDHEFEIEETESEKRLMRDLLRLRSRLSNELNVIPYMIASSVALTQLVKRKPTTMEELVACELDGFYKMKYERFGAKILSCINGSSITKYNESNKQSPTIVNRESLVSQQEKHNSSVTDLDWGSDLSYDDHELSLIADAIEFQMQPIQSNQQEILKTEYDLDLLLADLEKIQNEILTSPVKETTPPTSSHNSPEILYKYSISKKRCVMEYTDTDSSDEEEKNSEQLKPSSILEKPSPQKIRKLPSLDD